jgi:FkbM family methyltransferase
MNKWLRRGMIFLRGIATYRNWWEPPLRRIVNSYPHRVETRNGLRFVLKEPLDHYILNEIWTGCVYEKNGIELPKKGIVVDIGAHAGFFSLKAAVKGAEVFAFEPDPHNFKRLCEHAAMNPGVIVHASRSAVISGRKKRSEKLYISNSGGHSIIGKGRHILVKSTDFSDIIEPLEAVELLKIDCEGAEFEILLRSSPKLFDKIRQIAVEYHDNASTENHNEIVKRLGEYGYQVNCNNDHPVGLIWAIKKRAAGSA